MIKPCKQIATVYSFILAAAAFLVAYSVSKGMAGSLLVSAIVMLDLAATFFALKRRSLISFALSVVPAVLVWTYLCSRRIVFLVISLVISLALFLAYRGRLPDTRRTTDGWVGMLIITCITSLVPFIIIAAMR